MERDGRAPRSMVGLRVPDPGECRENHAAKPIDAPRSIAGGCPLLYGFASASARLLSLKSGDGLPGREACQ